MSEIHPTIGGMNTDTYKERVRTKLLKQKGHWSAIARETGVSRRWIQYFAADKISNPGIDTLGLIAKFLNVR